MGWTDAAAGARLLETAPKEMTKTAGGSELGVAGNGWDYGGNKQPLLLGEPREGGCGWVWPGLCFGENGD